jgi:hypothetical protein
MIRFFGLLISFVLISAFSYAQNSPEADNGSKFVVNPNPHTNNQTFDTPLEEIFGLNQNLFSGGPQRARGNFFTCTTSRRVIEHRLYLNPTVATDLYFCIYEGDAQVGTYNQISAVLVTGQGPGEGWYSSGPIDVMLTAGKFYVIYTQMDATTAYWTENPVTPFPDPCSFGAQTGGAGWATGSVPIYGNPPPATQTFTAAAFVDPVAYYQTIVTDDIGGGSFALPEVLYYIFDETGGNQTTNYAVPGRGFPVADVLGGLTMGPTGQFGSAVIGSGGSSSTDYVNTGWNTDIGTSSWTISMWLNNVPATTTLAYYFGDNTAGSFRAFIGGVAGSGNILLRATGMTDVLISGIVPGPTVIHIVYDATIPDVKTYKDGVLHTTVAQSALNINGTAPFKVAGYATSAGLSVGTLMDEFRFYSRALDAAEVAATWNISVIPVELTSFSASVNENNVKLLWTTATELNNSGFSIERNYANSGYTEVGFVPGFGTTTEPKSYSFTDNNLRNGVYTYRLKQIDFDGTFTYSDEVEVEVIAPASFSLDQNYPNPFNPTTRITFSLAVDSKVSLKIFDILGQEVASLVNQDLTQGVHTYDFNATGINSGVYFYKIEATGVNGNKFTDVKKMILVK